MAPHEPLTPRLARLLPLLVCPACRGDLRREPDALVCPPCAASYPLRGGQVHFVSAPPPTDELDRLKGALKRRLGGAYHTLGVNLIAPTFPFRYAHELRRRVDPTRALVVDLGSGNHRIDPDVVTVDLVAWDAVDVVCDLARLPFRADSVDAFASRSVLEHVPEPQAVVGELWRCTRPGGLSLHLVPFLYPFHASPHDYRRWTHAGLARLFEGFTVEEQWNATGPVTLGLLLATETGAALLGLGSERRRALAWLGLCGLTFPLKLLDAPFVGRRAFLGLAPTICTVLRKPS